MQCLEGVELLVCYYTTRGSSAGAPANPLLCLLHWLLLTTCRQCNVAAGTNALQTTRCSNEQFGSYGHVWVLTPSACMHAVARQIRYLPCSLPQNMMQRAVASDAQISHCPVEVVNHGHSDRHCKLVLRPEVDVVAFSVSDLFTNAAVNQIQG